MKAWLVNNNTKERLTLKYNPEGFKRGRSADYQEINSAGNPYPVLFYSKGNAVTFPLQFIMHDKPCSGLYKEYEEFFNSLMPSEDPFSSYERPPTITFCFGSFLRKVVLVSWEAEIEEMDSDLNPVNARFSLELRQVSSV